MDNKLSELSKPVAYSLRFRNVNGEPNKTINAKTTFSTLDEARKYGLGTRYVTLESGKIALARDPSQDPIVEPLYSQEYVSALLAELKAKDNRIGWLEAIATDYVGKFQKAQDALKYAAIMSDEDKKKISELEAKLATPVRLPDIRQSSSGDRYQWSDGAHNYRLDVISMLLGAGFTVAVEGDSE